jgi:hypothetical protein
MIIYSIFLQIGSFWRKYLFLRQSKFILPIICKKILKLKNLSSFFYIGTEEVYQLFFKKVLPRKIEISALSERFSKCTFPRCCLILNHFIFQFNCCAGFPAITGEPKCIGNINYFIQF